MSFGNDFVVFRQNKNKNLSYFLEYKLCSSLLLEICLCWWLSNPTSSPSPLCLCSQCLPLAYSPSKPQPLQSWSLKRREGAFKQNVMLVLCAFADWGKSCSKKTKSSNPSRPNCSSAPRLHPAVMLSPRPPTSQTGPPWCPMSTRPMTTWNSALI